MSNETLIETAPVRKEEKFGGSEYASPIDYLVDQYQDYVLNHESTDEDDLSELVPATIGIKESHKGDDGSNTCIVESELPSLSDQGQVAIESQMGGTTNAGNRDILLLPSQDITAFSNDGRWFISLKPEDCARTILANSNYLPPEIFSDDANGWYRAKWFDFFDELGNEDQEKFVWSGSNEYRQTENVVNEYEAWLHTALGDDPEIQEATSNREITERTKLENTDYSELVEMSEDLGLEMKYEPVDEIVDAILEAREDGD